jgi:hypothetical protein
MGVGAAPAESPPTPASDPILLADAHGGLALAFRDRVSKNFPIDPPPVARAGLGFILTGT